MPSVPTPGRGQVERGRRAEPARAEQQHLRVEQLHLPLEPDLRDRAGGASSARAARGERARDLDVVAAVLPERDAAAHRRDVLVAEQLLERVRGERGALAGRAVEDHALRAVVAYCALDARLEMAARHVHGAREMRLLELVLLAHVDDHGPAPVPVSVQPEVVDLLRVHLLDLLLDLADELCA
jgi:hypothetical protein